MKHDAGDFDVPVSPLRSVDTADRRSPLLPTRHYGGANGRNAPVLVVRKRQGRV